MPPPVKPGLTTGPDPSKLYLKQREIKNLKDLAKLTPEEAAVVNRADGIIASLPKDGFVDPAELTNPSFNGLLLPNEAQQVPRAISLMEWDGLEGPAVADLQPLTWGAKGAPPTLDRNEPMPIAELPAHLQELAQRVQLKMNGDANATTISPNETREFPKSQFVAGLLPEEQARLPELMEAVHELHNKKHPYPGAESIDVPALGRVETRLTAAASKANVTLRSDTALIETREKDLPPALSLTRTHEVVIEVPAGCRALLINAMTGVEKILEEGTVTLPLHAMPTPGQPQLLELWSGGKRVDACAFRVPNLPAVNSPNNLEKIDLQNQLGRAKFTSEGAPLFRNLDLGSLVPVGATKAYKANWTYSTVQAPPHTVDLSELTPAPCGLPPGVYSGQVNLMMNGNYNGFRPFNLEVTPEGVPFLEIGDQRALLTQALDKSYRGHAVVQAFANRLQLKGNELWLEGRGDNGYTSQGTAAILPSMRQL